MTISGVDPSNPAGYPSREKTKRFDDKSDLLPSSFFESETVPELDDFPPPDKDSERHYLLGTGDGKMELLDYAISQFEQAT